MDLIEIYQRLFLLEFRHNRECHEEMFGQPKRKECDCADTLAALRIEYLFATEKDVTPKDTQ